MPDKNQRRKRNKRSKLNMKRIVMVAVVAIVIVGGIGGTAIYFGIIAPGMAAQELENQKILDEYAAKYAALQPRIANDAFNDEEKQAVSAAETAFKTALDNKDVNAVPAAYTSLETAVVTAEKRISNDNAATSMADYQDVFNMLKNHDLSDFTSDEEAAVEANIAKMQAVLDNKETDKLETTINELAASIDLHYMTDNDVAITYKKGLIIANKNNCMPSSYAPGESAQARAAFEQMAADAANEGLYLNAFSTYRSYSGQASLYDRYVAADGQEAADRYSSRPGCSEHQTGLAFDIGGSNSGAWAETTFDDTDEAVWLANNAYKYGFILRYPPGKESVTGYMHESWHYRYVGDIAKTIYDSGKTLEEYLGVE